MAYSIKSRDDSIEDEDLENYVTGMWLQYKHNLAEPIPYLPVDCESVPFIQESNQYVDKQVRGMKCANMGDDTISLRHTLDGDPT